MRMLLLILAVAGGTALAQSPRVTEPAPPMVPAVTPPLGAASRALRHEVVARDRGQRVEEKAEDRADAEKRRTLQSGSILNRER